MRQQYKVVSMVVRPDTDVLVTTIKSNLSLDKANRLREKLESSNDNGDFNPDSLVSYLVEGCP